MKMTHLHILDNFSEFSLKLIIQIVNLYWHVCILSCVLKF